MIDLRGLLLLRELEARGTLSKAAEALHLSQSAASHRLAVLEREVGVPVTERIGRRLHLTEIGQQLADCAKRLKHELDSAEALIERARSIVAGRVRIGLFQTAALRILPQLLQKVTNDYPAVRLETTQMLAATALSSVQNGDLDIAVLPSYLHDPHSTTELHVEKLYTEDVVVMLPPDHRLSHRRGTLALSDLRAEKWIAGETINHFTSSLWNSAGFEPDIVHRSSDYTIMTMLVSGGHGISILPYNRTLGSLLPPVAVKRLKFPSAHYHVLAVLRENSLDRPAVTAVVDTMRRQLGPAE